jgi:hypothetical protein
MQGARIVRTENAVQEGRYCIPAFFGSRTQFSAASSFAAWAGIEEQSDPKCD